MLSDNLRMTVKGVIGLHALTDNWSSLSRHICDTPRRRKRRHLGQLKTLNAMYETLS